MACFKIPHYSLQNAAYLVRKNNKGMEKINVLLVEDEGTLAMIIKETLESQDFVIHTANDGMEGLRRFFDLRPDVVVADVMMPHLDGFEMVRRIRQTAERRRYSSSPPAPPSMMWWRASNWAPTTI